MPTIWEFENIENKHFISQRRLHKTFCISLREHAANVVNFEKKKMLLLTEKELKLHQDSTICYIYRKNSHKNL